MSFKIDELNDRSYLPGFEEFSENYKTNLNIEIYSHIN